MVALEELRRQSQVTADPKFPIRAWLKAGQKLKEAAEKDDRENNLEAAYVGYRKVANLLKAVLEHPDYKAFTSANPKTPDYYVYTDLKARVIPMTHRVRDIEQILQKREQDDATQGSDGAETAVNGRPSSSANGQPPSSTLNSASTMPVEQLLDRVSAPINAKQGSAGVRPQEQQQQQQQQQQPYGAGTSSNLTNGKTMPPPIPPTSSKPSHASASELSPTSSGSHYGSGPGTSSLPNTPTSPAKSGRISGSLQARMAALYNAGMQGAGEHAGMSTPPTSTPSSPQNTGDGTNAGTISPTPTAPTTDLRRSPAMHRSNNLPLPGAASSPPSRQRGSSLAAPADPQLQSILDKRTVSPAQADDPSKDLDRPDSAPPTLPHATAPASGPATSGHDMLSEDSDTHASNARRPSIGVSTNGDIPRRLDSLPSTEGLDDFESRFPDVDQEGFDILPSAPTFRPGDKNQFEKGAVPQPFHPAPSSTRDIHANGAPKSHDIERKRLSSSLGTDNTESSAGAGPPRSSNNVNGHSAATLQQAAASKKPAPLPTSQPPRFGRPPLPPVPQQPSPPNTNATYLSPADLWSYVDPSTSGPSVLLIDVRSRREFSANRIRGTNICIESFTLTPNSSASSIENSMVVSPHHEKQWFLERASFDLIVIYDHNTKTLPGRAAEGNHPYPSSASSGMGGFRNTPLPSIGGGPGPGAANGNDSTHFAAASAEAKAIVYLCSAIYEFNFSDEGKRLKRRPLLLTGGWDAWVRDIGEKGIQRDASDGSASGTMRIPPASPPRVSDKEAEYQAMLANSQRASSSTPGGSPQDVKKQHRRAVLSGDGQIMTPDSHYQHIPPMQPPPPAYQGYANPAIAVPPIAVHRTGPASPYEAYPTTPARVPNFGVHAPQRQISGNGEYFEPYGMPQSSQYGFSAQQPYSNGRPIDYPTLQQRHRAQNGSPGPPQPPTSLQNQSQPNQGRVQIPPPAMARAPSSSQSFQLLQNASYLTSPGTGAFPKQLYAMGDGAVGLTGLKNLGNTCYMNSMIQCLSATIPIARFLKEGSYKKAINKTNVLGTKGVLADAVAQLIQTLWSEQFSFLAPITFRDAICRFAPQFKGSDQHDSQEFLAFLLDGLHEDLNLVINKPPPVEFTPEREKELETLPTQIAAEREWNIYLRRDDSIIVRLLQGQYKSQLRCLTCGATSTTYNTFMYLSLPLPAGKGINRVTLNQCIDLFTQPETLDGDDAWNCPKCKKLRRATKALTISRLPAILLIHLKRFSFAGPFTNKIDTSVSFPVRGLDLTNYMPPPLDPALEARYSTAVGGAGLEKMPPPIYDLHAVSNHFGSLSSGHYTAFIKSRGHWSELNDSKISRTDEAHVASAGKSAYTLWYSRRP